MRTRALSAHQFQTQQDKLQSQQANKVMPGSKSSPLSILNPSQTPNIYTHTQPYPPPSSKTTPQQPTKKATKKIPHHYTPTNNNKLIDTIL